MAYKYGIRELLTKAWGKEVILAASRERSQFGKGRADTIGAITVSFRSNSFQNYNWPREQEGLLCGT